MFDLVLFGAEHDKMKTRIKAAMNTAAYQSGSMCIYCMDQSGEPDIEKYLSDEQAERFFSHDVSQMSSAEAYNHALKVTKGDIIMFGISDGSFEPGALESIPELIEKQGIVSLHPYYFNADGKEVSYTAYRADFDKKNSMQVDVETFPEKFHLCFSAFAFKKSLFEGRSFDERLDYDSENKMLMELLDDNKKYTFANYKFVSNDPNELDYFNYAPQFDKSWYQESMDNFLIDAVKENSSQFVQRFVLYMIVCRYACNMNERDKSILLPDEAQEFFEKTGKAIQHIDDVLIGSCHALNNKSNIPRFFALNLLRMKYNDEHLMPEITATVNDLSAYLGKAQMWSIGGTKLEFKVIYCDGENLTMDGFFPGSYVFPEGDIEVIAMINQSIPFPVRRNHIYALNKFFNVSAKGNYSFQFSIPLTSLDKVQSITFYLLYKGRKYPLQVTFIRAQTKLSHVSGSYWICGQSIITYNGKRRSFIVEPLTKKAHCAHEKKFIKGISKSTHGMWKIKMVGNRLLYWVTKPFYKKKIWLTMDKIFKAGDNGEYFYRYVKAHQPEDVKIYYVVAADSPDYARLKSQYNTIVKFNSIKHKMLALHTDLMLATHVDTMNCNGYYHATQKYFKDLYNARVVCLAHGLTIQRIAQYQNRVFDNTVLYFFASKYEVKNVSHEIYDYYDKRALCLTGHARYDGLVSNDKKIILITPTWRRSVTTGKAKKGATYSHSSSFAHSDYFKIYNGLINDERLIAAAKEHGYRIVYLLHPAMSNQLEDFEKSDGVDIVAATGDISYEKILTESSLMVTDYSGVQFDFAYMKKPLVYYHPDVLPPQYEAGGLEYDTMGFGPICRNHQQIVDTLCSYIENSCVMEDKYKARVDDFFEYSDHNNCERIFKEVMKFQSRFRKVNNPEYL